MRNRKTSYDGYVIGHNATIVVGNWPDEDRDDTPDKLRLRFCKLNGLKIKHASVIEMAHGITIQELFDHPIMKGTVVFLPALPVVGEPRTNHGTVVQYLAIRYRMDGEGTIRCGYGVVVETCTKKPEWIVMPLVFTKQYTARDFLAMRGMTPLFSPTYSTIPLRVQSNPYRVQYGLVVSSIFDPNEGPNQIRGKLFWHSRFQKVVIGRERLLCRFWDHKKDKASTLELNTPTSRLWTFAARDATKPMNIPMFSAFEVDKQSEIIDKGFLFDENDERLVWLRPLDAESDNDLEQAMIKLMGTLVGKTFWSGEAHFTLTDAAGWGTQHSIGWGRHEVAAKNILAYPVVIWDTAGPRVEFIIKGKGEGLDLRFLAGANKITRSISPD